MMKTTDQIPRDLCDEEGENRAVRSFLMQYSCDRALTVGEMRKHMDRSGWPLQFCPAFARLGQHDKEHLTKAGAQLWLRHLFDMEQVSQRAALQELALCDGSPGNVSDAITLAARVRAVAVAALKSQHCASCKGAGRLKAHVACGDCNGKGFISAT